MMKKIFVQIFCTKIGWFAICLLLVGLFGILSDYYDSLFFPIAMYASLVYPVVFIIILIVYVLIINPIRERKEAKKLKENGNK